NVVSPPSLHDALPIWLGRQQLELLEAFFLVLVRAGHGAGGLSVGEGGEAFFDDFHLYLRVLVAALGFLPQGIDALFKAFKVGERSEEHTSELQSRENL